MGYKLMSTLIKNYKNGRKTYTKDRLLEMCDVYYASGRLTDAEYTELTASIYELDKEGNEVNEDEVD